MKLLLFSDLHADKAAARRLVDLAADADVVIGAGDFGNGRQQVNVCIDILKSIKKPALLVPGNNESTDELAEACHDWPSAIVLHGTGTKIAGVDFFGIGGGIPVTAFGPWSFDFTEPQATELLRDCPSECVLISHSPPKDAVDASRSRKSLGSSSVRAAIERCQPRLVVCGHIHESAGKEALIGVSPVINVGPTGREWTIEVPSR